MKRLPIRYLVRLPAGEREMDSRELLERFSGREFDTVTPVRPAAGGDWRELRADPELAAPVRWRWEKIADFGKMQIVSVLASLFCIALPYLLVFILGWEPGLFLWPLTLFYVFLYAGVSADTLWSEPDIRMLVPYWNCFLGFRRCRRLITELPPERRRIPGLFNPVCWTLLFLTYASTVFAPYTVAGGMTVYLLYSGWVLALVPLATPLLLERRRRNRAWRERNPPPEPAERPMFPDPRAIRWSRLLRGIAALLLCLLSAAAAWTLPCWAVGTLRLWFFDNAGHAGGIPLSVLEYGWIFPEPNARSAVAALEIPEFPCEPPGDDELREKTRELAPRLDAFRAVLRGNSALGVPLFDASGERSGELDRANGKMRDYLRWRVAEFELNPELPAAELQRDFEIMRDWTVREDPESALFRQQSRDSIRSGWLTAALPRMTRTELDREREWWRRESGGAQTLAERQMLSRAAIGLRPVTDSLWLLPCRNLIEAHRLSEALEAARFLSNEYYEIIGTVRERAKKSGMFGPDFHNVTLLAHVRAVCRLAQAGIGLEEFRRVHGTWPETPELPNDPFTGTPLKYLPGKRIYSVGRDVSDGSGTPAEKRNRDRDIIFRLPQLK